MKRRLAFALSVGLLVACAGPAAGQNPALPQNAASFSGLSNQGTAFTEPPVVRAVNGVARFSLDTVINPETGQPAFRYLKEIGVEPTVAVNPGERIEVELHDHLPKAIPPAATTQGADDMAGMDGMGPDSTGDQEDVNLHFHGIGSSPQRPGDDVLTMLAKPGQTLHYVVHIPPNQEPGLYWYHAHVHGETNYQVGESGMSGAIIVTGLERHLPLLGKMKQRLLIVRSTGVGADAKTDFTNTAPCATKDHLVTTINGVFRPDIPIQPGERQFFRLVNATGHKTLKLNIAGERLELVAIDGFALDTNPGTPASESRETIVVPPASRAEFVVTGPASGHAELRTLCFHTGRDGDPDPMMTLAYLKSTSQSQRVFRSRAPIVAGPPLPRNFYDTQLPPPSVKRLVVFSEDPRPQFFINGKSYNPKSKPMFVVHVGTTEEWHVENVTHEVHDFHIHQTHFLVERIDGVPVLHPHWADSQIIPHEHLVNGKWVPGSLTLLMNFRDPIIRGEFLFHCHILDHEDQGMMAKIEAI
jgi:FtsP/CotA-like multicopper oxidase with cupredoxin domain